MINQDSEELQRRISYFPARTTQMLLQHQKHICKSQVTSLNRRERQQVLLKQLCKLCSILSNTVPSAAVCFSQSFQSTIWAAKHKFRIPLFTTMLSALSWKGRQEQISYMPLAAVCPNLNSFITFQNLLSVLLLTVGAGRFLQMHQPLGCSLKRFL